MNRRKFIKQSSSVLAAAAAASYVPTTFAAEKKRRVGLIGTGWYGKIDLLRLIQIEPVEVVSLCDVDSKMLDEAADIVAGRQKSGKRPRLYHDYREMLKEKDLDICLIGTPDHWHALTMIEACKSGADLYCQKPISVDVVEGQAMLKAARKYNRVVQIGTQRRSTPHLIEARDRVINEGLLGKIAHVEICCYYHMRNGLTIEQAPDTTPPENLDYKFWSGPAPWRPYNKIDHPRGWRAFMEYGNGIVGDMCVHMLDMTRWMLNLGWPKEVNSIGGIYMDKDARANISDTQTATFKFDDLDVVWTHRSWGEAPDKRYPWSAIFYGEKGVLKASVDRYEFFPNGKNEPTLSGTPLFEYDKYPEDKTEKDLERHVASAVRWHMMDLLKAIDHRTRPVADIEQGFTSTTSCILANLSMKLGRSLRYDPQAGRIIDDPEANNLLSRVYNDPWQHPNPDTV
ncbi:gfo/Idh/MocA family oxidoreductase [bacterium]|nr:gfo/Idh/MocA family oxidoreductase [bacterium]